MGREHSAPPPATGAEAHRPEAVAGGGALEVVGLTATAGRLIPLAERLRPTPGPHEPSARGVKAERPFHSPSPERSEGGRPRSGAEGANCGCGECLVNSHCYFSGVDQAEKATLEERLVANRYKKNQVIAHEGVRPHGVFLLCSGQSKVCKTDESGHQLAVRVGRAGTLVGYRSLLLDEPFSATVEATEASVVTFLDKEYFFDLLRRQPTLMMRLIRQLAEQVGQAEEIALTMAYHGSYRRVAELLAGAIRSSSTRRDAGALRLNLSSSPQRSGGGDNFPVHLPPIRRQDLAQRAGLALETTIRILKDMEERGFIRLKGRQITVLNARKIDELVDASE